MVIYTYMYIMGISRMLYNNTCSAGSLRIAQIIFALSIM